jgi:sulfur-carrier protein
MIQVSLSGPLRAGAGGKAAVEIASAATIRELLDRLGEVHPDLKPLLEKGVAVSINGQIYRNAWFQPIPADADIHILPPLAGG